MKIVFHKTFLKQFRKLHQNIKIKFYGRLEIFEINKFNPVLNNHSLHYPYEGCQSINVTGNIRALYDQQ